MENYRTKTIDKLQQYVNLNEETNIENIDKTINLLTFNHFNVHHLYKIGLSFTNVCSCDPHKIQTVIHLLTDCKHINIDRSHTHRSPNSNNLNSMIKNKKKVFNIIKISQISF